MMNGTDLTLYHAGQLLDAYNKLGAHCAHSQGTPGVWFTTWAPDAATVSVVGDFNAWDGRRHPMQRADDGGVWELFVPELPAGTQYKFELLHKTNGRLVIKTDPFARAFPSQANTNAVVMEHSAFRWGDRAWMDARRNFDWQRQPLLIYEVHLGSWRRNGDGNFQKYEQLADQLCTHARKLRYTHIELLPIFEHPLDESLGYQVTGYYAPTSRFGSPDEFRTFVDRCHDAGLGVILDWVPLHFPKDYWGLSEFDGAALYERQDPTMAEHPTWQTLIFNYGRPEVRNFLLSNALYWLLEFHVDGLRVDAVSSMLYLDDARTNPDWKRNPLGGRENLTAVRFLREMNATVAQKVPDAFTIAEEATSWPAVSQPAPRGGLGFSMKWNMGWVHDTLAYMARPWNERAAHHRDLTFERLYAKKEQFVLALSHDETVSHRGTLLRQMYGSEEEKFAALRLLFTFQTTYPGKKLLFMGNEFGSSMQWNATRELPWAQLDEPAHRQIVSTVTVLNGLYNDLAALHRSDFDEAGFRWLSPDDARHCVIAYMRSAGEAFVVVVLNFSADSYEEYLLGVPRDGNYQILFDSDALAFGGRGQTQILSDKPQRTACMGLDYTLTLRLSANSGALVGLA